MGVKFTKCEIYGSTIQTPYEKIRYPIIAGVKDLNSTVVKRGSVFIGLMTPYGAIWFRYQRAVLIR